MVKKTIERGPDFLCIGESRCGTSWLHVNLSNHPQLWLPPVKELRFFDSFLHEDWRRVPLIFRDDYSRKRARMYLRQQVKSIRRGRPPTHVLWILRYFLFPPGDEWYMSLFPTGRRVRGECSPTYARLPVQAIRHVSELLPDVQLIYFCRNPVHRDWSLAALMLKEKLNIGIDDATDLQISRALGKKDKDSTNYLANLIRWEQFYSRDRIFVAFHDEIVEEPEEMLLRIYRFLGVDASRRHIGKSAHKKIATRPYRGIPERYARMLSERYYDQVVRMHERFDNAHTRKWLDYVTERVEAR